MYCGSLFRLNFLLSLRSTCPPFPWWWVLGSSWVLPLELLGLTKKVAPQSCLPFCQSHSFHRSVTLKSYVQRLQTAIKLINWDIIPEIGQTPGAVRAKLRTIWIWNPDGLAIIRTPNYKTMDWLRTVPLIVSSSAVGIYKNINFLFPHRKRVFGRRRPCLLTTGCLLTMKRPIRTSCTW